MSSNDFDRDDEFDDGPVSVLGDLDALFADEDDDDDLNDGFTDDLSQPSHAVVADIDGADGVEEVAAHLADDGIVDATKHGVAADVFSDLDEILDDEADEDDGDDDDAPRPVAKRAGGSPRRRSLR